MLAAPTAAAAAAAPPLSSLSPCVVWDFDHSLVDCNSDTFVPRRLAPQLEAHVRAELARGTPWTALMADVAARMHAAGVTRPEVEAALCAMPVFPATLAAIRAAAAAGVEQRVLSDANAVFITRFLEHHGLADSFASIDTNPAVWRADGLLEIAPYTGGSAPHACARCPPNLCKGLVLDALGLSAGRAPAALRRRVVYVGDGGGDVCPALRLGAGDVVLARRGLALARALGGGGEQEPLLRAALVEWGDGDELREALLECLGLGATEQREAHES